MSKSKPARKDQAYHHGDLKSAIRSAAVALMIERQESSFTLRELAKRLSVSHPALYRHYSNKREVLAAVAEEGFRQLAIVLSQVQKDYAQYPEQQLHKQAKAYIDFASHWPGHYRAMFHPELSNKTDLPELLASSDAAAHALMQTVESGRTSVFQPISSEALFLFIWATLHGYSELLINKQFESARTEDAKMLEQRSDELIQILMAGVIRKSEIHNASTN